MKPPNSEHHELSEINDLSPFDRNPRYIDDQAKDGLRMSLSEFGDLSGIVYNRRTGRLVSGHQRVEQLKILGARLDQTDGPALVTDEVGYRWPIRVVDWDETTEKAANITANNQYISGAFTDGLNELLGELRDELPSEQLGALRLDALETESGWMDRGSIDDDTGSLDAPAASIRLMCAPGDKERLRSCVLDAIEQAGIPGVTIK
jgi:ParB-like chromosome segregation protein Spo0J